MSGSRWDEPELADDSTEVADVSGSRSSEDLEELDPAEAIDTTPVSRDLDDTTDRWAVRTDSAERALPDSVVKDPDSEVTREGTRRVYSALCAMAHVEHRPTAAQRQELLDYQDYLGVSPWVAKLIEAQARRSPELRVGRRLSELELVMNAMIDMACADGNVSMAEGRLLARVNERAGWSREQVGAAIKRSLARQATALSELQPVEVEVQVEASKDPFAASDVAPTTGEPDAEPDVIEIRAIQVDHAIRVVEPIEVQTTHEPDERGGGLLPLSDEQPIAIVETLEPTNNNVWDVSCEKLTESRDEDQRARDELDKLDELLSGLSRRTEARGKSPAEEPSDEAPLELEESGEKPIKRGKRVVTKKPSKKVLEAPKKLAKAPKVLALVDEELEELDAREPAFRVAESVDAPIGLQSVIAPNPFEDSGDEELVLLSPLTLPLRKRA